MVVIKLPCEALHISSYDGKDWMSEAWRKLEEFEEVVCDCKSCEDELENGA